MFLIAIRLPISSAHWHWFFRKRTFSKRVFKAKVFKKNQVKLGQVSLSAFSRPTAWSPLWSSPHQHPTNQHQTNRTIDRMCSLQEQPFFSIITCLPNFDLYSSGFDLSGAKKWQKTHIDKIGKRCKNKLLKVVIMLYALLLLFSLLGYFKCSHHFIAIIWSFCVTEYCTLLVYLRSPYYGIQTIHTSKLSLYLAFDLLSTLSLL